jgi:membrane protein implicated in regulation of membrane protease activity
MDRFTGVTSWTARPYTEADVYQPGEQVTVMHVDGATAMVWKSP